MARPDRGIGKGLAAILPSSGQAGPELRELPVELIQPNPRQPRTRFEAEPLEALASSIAETGVIQPLIVRPLAGGRYELIAGERRWRAAAKAGLERLPAVIRDEDEGRRLELALVENMAREDLNPVDAARACAALVEDLGLSKEEVGRRVGKSRPAVSNLIRLLDLPKAVLGLIEEGRLSEGHGRAVLQVPGNDARRDLARQAAAKGWSVRQTERRAKALADGPARGAKGSVALHPDQEAARQRAEEMLQGALGEEVVVRVQGGRAVAEVRFENLEQLSAFAEHFGLDKAA